MSIKVFNSLSNQQKAELKKGVIEVHGKAMNRTALGIVDAMITLYPNASIAELKEMMPDDLNVAAPKNYKSLFKPYTDRMYGVIQPGSIRKECEEQGLDIHASHFTEEVETFKSADGVEVLVAKSWESSDTETGNKDLQLLIDAVKKYGVSVVDYEDKKPFGKGGYKLEVVNPELMKLLHKKRSNSLLKLVVFGIALTLLLAALIYVYKSK